MIDLKKMMKGNDHNKIEFYYGKERFEKTFSEIYSDALKLLSYFREKNIEPRDKIGACGNNCYQLILIDLACFLGGIHYIPIHRSQLENNIELFKRKLDVKLFILEENLEVNTSIEIMLLSDVESVLQNRFKYNLENNETVQFQEDEYFTTILTSGTTGNSKWFHVKLRCLEQFIELCVTKFQLTKKDKVFLFLPLSQFSSRSYLFASIQNQIDFVLTNAEYLLKALKWSKPTVLQGVPFFYNNLYEAFISTINKNVINRFVFVAYKGFKHILPTKIDFKIQRKLFKKIYAFWGGNIRVLVTGAAPSRKEVLSFFNMIGLPIYEVYGLVETGLITMNYPGSVKIGSVGKILPYMEFKFDDNQQLYVKSDKCWGEKYLNCSKEENMLTFRDDGYIATGDIGYLDSDGFLYLLGRAKEVIVLQNGNNIYPTSLENELNSMQYIKQSAVFGNGKPFLIAVIVPRDNAVTKNEIMECINRINGFLKGKGVIKDYIISSEEFNVGNKMMNENMKINRKNIYSRYKIQIDDMYGRK